jgi:lipoyl(octanoyl) transferase
MHGFAFNVSTDLSYFNLIVPCGISDRKVTSLEKLLDRSILMDEVRQVYAESFAKVFERTLVEKESAPIALA